jgi:hypothetical protein
MIAHTKKVIASQSKRKDLQLDLEHKKQLLQKAKSKKNESLFKYYQTYIEKTSERITEIEETIIKVTEKIVSMETMIQVIPVKSASKTIATKVSAAVIAKRKGLVLVQAANKAKSDALNKFI